MLLPAGVVSTNKKILLVEDHDECRQLLTKLIASLGYEVIQAATGVEALEQAAESHPDLIMMDLRLPQMNGDEATARLKMNPFTRDIPVIINTAWLVGDRADQLLDLGAAEVLYKPFDFQKLSEILHRYLGA